MRIHGGYLSPEFRGIDFSNNLNPFAPPEEVLEIIKKPKIEWFTTHPPPYTEELERAIEKRLDLPVGTVAVIPGSVYGIHLAFQLTSPERVVLPHPTFNEYRRLAEVLNIPVYLHSLKEDNGFRLCLGELASTLDEGDLVFVCNPNNPTGYFFGVEEVKGLLRWCEREDVFVVFDEAFIDFTEHNQDTPFAVIDSKSGLILRSFTKTFSIPGVRIGYVIGHPDIVSRIRDLVPSWSITQMAVEVAKACLRNWHMMGEWRNNINREKAFLTEKLKSLPLKPFSSSANFIFTKSLGEKAEKIKDKLLVHGIAIRTFPEFGETFDSFFRISVRDREDNLRLLRALEEVL